LVIAVLLLLWLVRQSRQFTSGPRWLNLPLLALLVWLTLSIAWAGDKSLAAITAAHWWLAYGWYLYLLNRVEDIGQILNPLTWGIGLQAAWGVMQYMVNHSLGLPWLGESVLNPQVSGVPVVIADGIRQLRAHGTLPHANMLGGVLVAAVPALIYWYATLSRSQLRRWLAAIIILVAMAVGLSFARGAWMVLGVSLITMIVSGWGWGNRRQANIALGALLFFVVTLATQYQFVLNRFNLSDSLEERSVNERIEGAAMWERVAGANAVRGVGIGNYAVALQTVDGTQPVWWYQPVHNIYLLVTGELGIVGAAIWAWLIAALVWFQVKLRRRPEAWLLVLPLDAWLALGLVDHWPVSLQQGRLLLFMALVLLILASKVSLTKPESKLY